MASDDDSTSSSSPMMRKKSVTTKNKKSMKSSTRRIGIDDEAEVGSGSDSDSQPRKKKARDISDDESEEEDQDAYVADGFVVNDELSDSDEDLPKKRSSKSTSDSKKLNKLRKKKTDAVLDEDDLILMEERADHHQRRTESWDLQRGGLDAVAEDSDEERAQAKRAKKKAAKRANMGSEKLGDEDSDESESDEESDEDDRSFIVDDESDSGNEGTRMESTSRGGTGRSSGRSNVIPAGSNLVTTEQLNSLKEMFGDDYEFDDEFGGEGVGGWGDEHDEETSAIIAANQAAAAASGSSFEYIKMVENFYLDSDERLRVKDDAERLQIWMRGRLPSTPNDRKAEAAWLLSQLERKLTTSLYGERGEPVPLDPTTSTAIISSLEEILHLLLVERMEVPFIWLYRREAVHRQLKKEHLWDVVFLDERWDAMQKGRLRLEACHAHLTQCVEFGESVKELRSETQKRATLPAGEFASVAFSTSASQTILNAFPAEKYLSMAMETTDELVMRDLSAYLRLLCRGREKEAAREDGASNGELTSRRLGGGVGSSGDKYARYKDLAPVRELAGLLAHPAHVIGTNVRLGYDQAPPVPPATLSVQDYAENLLQEAGGDIGGFIRSGAALVEAANLVLMTELAAEPAIREAIRGLFLRHGSFCTRPTERGRHSITPFSESFGYHWLDHKPIPDVLNTVDDAKLFLRAIDLEASKEVTLTINPPHTCDGNVWQLDRPLIMGHKNLMRLVVGSELGQPGSTEATWAQARLNLLESMLEKVLLPSLAVQLRSLLLRTSKDVVVEEMADIWSKRLMVGPLDGPLNEEPYYLWRRRLLSSPPQRTGKNDSLASFFWSHDTKPALHMVAVDGNGLLLNHQVIMPQGMGQKKERIVSFLYDYRPSVIAINSGGGRESRNLQSLIEKNVVSEIVTTLRLEYELVLVKRQQARHDDDMSEESDYEEQEAALQAAMMYRPTTLLVEDELANIFKSSTRASVLCPELPRDGAAALCLARYVQEPLVEYANLWTAVDSSSHFGFEALYLKLHPLQHHVTRVGKERVLRVLESRLVDAISDMGVEFNHVIQHDHCAALLAFLPGLGLRKAAALRSLVQALRAQKVNNERNYAVLGSVNRRQDLISKKLMGEVVFQNVSGFLRFPISAQKRQSANNHTPGVTAVGSGLCLEDSRIHPECYVTREIVQDLCYHAMEERSREPGKSMTVVNELLRDCRERLIRRLERETPENKEDTGSLLRLFVNANGHPDVYDRKNYGDIIGVDGTLGSGDSLIDSKLNDSLAAISMKDMAAMIKHTFRDGNCVLELEQIKRELRFPWLDRRTPMTTLSEERLFEITSQETRFSLHVGLRIGATVMDFFENTMTDSHTGITKRRQKAILKLDNGLRGVLYAQDLTDERIDPESFDMRDYLTIGQHIIGVVCGVMRNRQQVEVTMKRSYLERDEGWWLEKRNDDQRAKSFFISYGIRTESMFDSCFNEREAIHAWRETERDNRKKAESALAADLLTRFGAEAAAVAANSSAAGFKNQTVRRVIYHPLFVNLDFRSVEKRLRTEDRGAGAVYFRPSSKGHNFLTITWAFQPHLFKHISVEEHGKRDGDMGLGPELLVQEDDLKNQPFHDLDDLYSNYIEPMNDLVSAMTAHKNFRSGSAAEVEEELRQQCSPGRIPYFIRLDETKPGFFILTWMGMSPNGQPGRAKTLRVEVRPKGYRIKNEMFGRPSEVIGWFKKMNDPANRPAIPVHRAPPPPHVMSGYAPPPPQHMYDPSMRYANPNVDSYQQYVPHPPPHISHNMPPPGNYRGNEPRSRFDH